MPDSVPPGARWLSPLEARIVKFLAETESRDRIMPYTNSPLDPTPDPTGAKPFSDNDNFKRYIPGSGDGAPNLD